ncbi:hypothetical protein NGA_0715900 [Nannochloropsis gaditana CCMP526]|nr:hypothetical protein NGA_0715900 [Nannochloropsis gaditana CCMP526]EKU23479.1 hypothetical protein NGA_0715900 [Nannochloropsis gaditana CCMP526]|eukprot:XP_005852348.1 hypothetical protein NGA_0715900 [Nannochloropsis gaditana CCMP526]
MGPGFGGPPSPVDGRDQSPTGNAPQTPGPAPGGGKLSE